MLNFWQKLPKPFFVLAPMDGATDIVFRRVVAQAARPDVFFTEFTNTDSYCSPKGQASTYSRLHFSPEEQPIVAQIWGTNPEHFSIMAKGLKEMGYAGIDINMGCPVHDVVKKGACSALIETPALAQEIIEATKEGGLPVSVKTRVGFKQQKTEEWVGFLLQQDLAALTIHARTAKEMSKVPARWEEIAKAVNLRNEIAPHTRIIGNGDVRDRQDGIAKATLSRADGIMIGRGAFNNPYCFADRQEEPSIGELLGLLELHLNLFDSTWPEHPYPPLKRFFKVYVKNFANASDFRDQLMQTTSTAEARQIIKTMRTPLGTDMSAPQTANMRT